MTNINILSFSSFNSSDSHDEEIGEVCIANISPKERQLRKRFAIQQFVFTLVLLVGLVALHVNPIWRLLLFFMFSAATTSYMQAFDKT